MLNQSIISVRINIKCNVDFNELLKDQRKWFNGSFEQPGRFGLKWPIIFKSKSIIFQTKISAVTIPRNIRVSRYYISRFGSRYERSNFRYDTVQTLTNCSILIFSVSTVDNLMCSLATLTGHLTLKTYMNT